MRKPFDIREIFFDAVVAVGSLIVGEIIVIGAFLLLYGNIIERLFQHIIPAIIVSIIWFYAMRRRFDWKITILQIVITSILTLLISLTWMPFLKFFPYILFSKISLLFVLTPATLVLTKHLSDKIILTKTTAPNSALPASPDRTSRDAPPV